jgi:hypothetical protein
MPGLSNSYPTGSNQTITLQANTATISSAFYGVDANQNPLQVPAAADGKSVTVTVLAGPNLLTINLISPSLRDEVGVLSNGAGTLAVVTVSAGIGVAAIGITGT